MAPDAPVPLSDALNKQALALQPQVRERNDGNEEALTATAGGKVAKAAGCDTSDCSAPVIKDAVLLLHYHPKLKADGDTMRERRLVEQTNRKREIPGPDDWKVIQQFRIPNHVVTPSFRLVGFEYREYNNIIGYYYSYIGAGGQVTSGPHLWDQQEVK